MAGNFYGNNIQLGRSDADFGTLLINKGKGSMNPIQLPGLMIKGEVRKISPLATGAYPSWVLSRNNDSAMIISIQGNRPAASPPGNR